ncbi:MAG TPA: FumA C-terminus/TtdB family hydratase beta subunit [Tepidisphaeraceae bacterium]|nr:FumA C-terminus/TtdB family hydratase beta subunit [Tepidisphaeraceae bacterium]
MPVTFNYEPTLQLGDDDTQYRLLTRDGVSTIDAAGRTFLKVEPAVLQELAKQALTDISFYLRTSHLKRLSEELSDPEASDNDKFVIYTHLQNAVVAAAGQLPTCQDTGTAVVVGKKGQYVLTDCDDAEWISRGVFDVYQQRNLRYSQLAPIEMFKEANTGTNLPAQIDISAEPGSEFKLLFMAKGGGSANKMYFYQATPAILNEDELASFVASKLKDIGTSACPPYHLAVVVGGTSAETTMKTLKLASAGYLDHLPTTGSAGGRAFRVPDWEQRILRATQHSKIGAQFGGKYFAHDVRVIRLPRHAASMPIGIGVSCSADRQIKTKITHDGVFIEQLETNPGRFLPTGAPKMAAPVKIDLNMGMPAVLKILSQFPVKTRVELTGTLIVARDAAHARIRQMLDAGQPMPQYFKDHPIYYAGPAKTPEGMPTGSFGPTTAGRMDGFVDQFQSQGGSLIMLAKGNRSRQVTDACQTHGGFYLGSIGGPAAILAQLNIKRMELVDFEDLGMEAIRKIEVVNFPAFIVVDDKGNDFFEAL